MSEPLYEDAGYDAEPVYDEADEYEAPAEQQDMKRAIMIAQSLVVEPDFRRGHPEPGMEQVKAAIEQAFPRSSTAALGACLAVRACVRRELTIRPGDRLVYILRTEKVPGDLTPADHLGIGVGRLGLLPTYNAIVRHDLFQCAR
jgi:hypothetical protein